MTGIVVAIDEQSCRARVKFPDRDDMISAWLPVMQSFCVGNQEYRLPDEGNQVVCLMDVHYEDGVVLGAIYSDADPPPVADKDLFYRRFKDGSTLVYDRKNHKLTAGIQGDIEISATGTITSTAALWTHNGSFHATEDISDGVRSLAADRAIYNDHTNPNDGAPPEKM